MMLWMGLTVGWLGAWAMDHSTAPGVHRKTVAGQVDCGPNYLLPDDTARLGSHTFVILGKDGPAHIWGAHRSGTPPHNVQFIWRVRLDPHEMAFYEQVAAASSTLPAFTTIQYSPTGQQLERTFFCLHDLPEMLGAEARADDRFAPLFPIRAALLANAQHEAIFKIGENVVPGGHFELDRADIELVLHRYLPAYVDPEALRRTVAAHPELTARFGHAPQHPVESPETAARPGHWMSEVGQARGEQACPRNFKLPGQPVRSSPHTFVLLGPLSDGRELGVHLVDPAPHNFQTFLALTLDEPEQAMVAKAHQSGGVVLLQADAPGFCLSTLRTEVAAGRFSMSGTLRTGASVAPWSAGTELGRLSVGSGEVEVLVNRELASFLDPREVVGEQ